MNCFKKKSTDRRFSDEIDKKISRWMKDYTKIIKFLLLGAGESGKTTILKQMRILHIEGFSDSERREKVADIRRNVLEAIKELTSNMKLLQPPVNLDNPNNKSSLDFIYNINMSEQYDYPQEFYDHVERLWADAGVQKCFLRSNEFPLIDSAKYFLDRLGKVRADNYMPSDQDILHCRKRTCEIQKIEFKMKIPKGHGSGTQSFWMFDVGGQRGERRKWIQVFDGITAVLFLVACSGFDMKIREDSETSRLKESLALFEDVWHSRFLRSSGFILFLNKQDILKEKIERGCMLQNFFPAYRDYVLKATDGDPTCEYERARCFIRDQFLEATKKPPPPRRSSSMEVCLENEKSLPRRDCYWHFTTATDTNNVERVFNDIHTMIIMWALEKIGPN